MTPPVGVVLAGGASSRMGTDKAFVEVSGRAMVLRVADALRNGDCDPVVCQGGDATRLAVFGLETWPDTPGPRGPAGAVVAALGAAVERHPATTCVVVAACDLPALTGTVVRGLVAASAAAGVSAVAVAGGRTHLVGAWPVNVVRALTESIDHVSGHGPVSFRDLVAAGPSVSVEVDPAFLVNVNRPEEIPTAGRRRR